MPPMAQPIGGMMMSLDQRIDDAGECRTDHDTDRQVDDVAAHGEFLEFLEHENPRKKPEEG